ncbi:MAG TPA: hypothetical protein VFB84_00400 [Micromonosporaceae bacterium]|nr:hypothetical protein [Micromonosporaceae bacterium]
MLAGLPLALAAFIVAVVAIAAGVGNLLLVVGFPILAGAFLVLRALADTQSWLDLLYWIVVFPVSVATCCLAVVWRSGAIGGLLY